MIALSAGAEISFGGEITMNTDKIYAEALANEYAPKEASKVLALKKLDMKAKSKANIFSDCQRSRRKAAFQPVEKPGLRIMSRPGFCHKVCRAG